MAKLLKVTQLYDQFLPKKKPKLSEDDKSNQLSDYVIPIDEELANQNIM